MPSRRTRQNREIYSSPAFMSTKDAEFNVHQWPTYTQTPQKLSGRYCEPTANDLWIGHDFDRKRLDLDVDINQFKNFIRNIERGSYDGMRVQHIDNILKIDNPSNEHMRYYIVDLIYGLAKNIDKISHTVWKESDIKEQILEFTIDPNVERYIVDILVEIKLALRDAFGHQREKINYDNYVDY